MFYLRVGLSLLGFVGASIYAIALAMIRKDRSRVAYDYAMAMARLMRAACAGEVAFGLMPHSRMQRE